jgi:hypothetical protein
MVTRGHRTIGRTIRKLSNSVEFSDKESLANDLERKRIQRTQINQGNTEDSPVQDLRKIANKKK